jgi:hypothetical protein
LTGQSVQSLFKKETVWKIETQNENYLVEKLILATEATQNMGNDADLWSRNCKSLPFFTFIKDRIRITRCRGTCKVKDTKLESTGPLLITLGMSGPVLKLSAWGEFCMIKLSVYHICKLVDVI